MDFQTSETRSLLRDTADRFVRDRYDFDARKKILASPEGFSRSIWREFADLGLLGVDASEDHGGTGGDFGDLAVVLEAFGRALVVEPYLSSMILSPAVLRAAGDAAKQDELAPQLVAGDLTMSLACGEAASRYDLAHVATTARREGEGYVLNGAKAVVLGADSADLLIVSARTSGGERERDGVSLFLVARGAEGLAVRGYRNLDDRGAGEVALENVAVGPQALMGAEGQGTPALEAAVDRAAAAVCCEAVGAMEALNQLTLEYLKTRNQFGRPIGKFQVLQHRMADMAMAEQTARSMMHLAIAHADDPDPVARARAISAAKAQIGKCALEVGRGAIQLHGGIGMTMEYVAAHYFRRLTAFEKLFGDTDFHLDRFAALS